MASVARAGDLSGMGPRGGGGVSRVSLSTLLAEAELPDSDDGAEAVSSPLSGVSSLFTVCALLTIHILVIILAVLVG